MGFLADFLEPFIGDPGAENPVPTPITTWEDTDHIVRRLTFSYPTLPTSADVQSVTIALGPYRSKPWTVLGVMLAPGTRTVIARVKNEDNASDAEKAHAAQLEAGAMQSGAEKLARETEAEVTGDIFGPLKKIAIVAGIAVALVVLAGLFYRVRGK